MQIFFSYGHDKHREVVKKLADEIKQLGNGDITVWIDSHEILRDSHWRERITDGILKSDSVIAFLSEYSSRERSVCLDEISIALVSKHGMIRTILLESPSKFTPSSRVTEYQWGDMSDYPAQKEKGSREYDEYIRLHANEIIELVNSDDMLKYNEEVQVLRSALDLPSIDNWTKFDELIKKEMVGREWLLDKIKNWEEDDNGSNVLMIYGKPGAGKSMFSAYLQMTDPAVIAAFPCDCRAEEYSNTDSIVINIAYRLALRLPDYRKWVLNLAKNGDLNLNGKMLFDRLILQPLSNVNIDGQRAVMIIVIDALDEMINDELADFIRNSAEYLRKYIRFLITSRKTPKIVERFSSFPCIDLDDEADRNKEDMLAYFESRLGEKLSKYDEKDEFIKRLIDSSDGMFAYAESVCLNILNDIEHDSFVLKEYKVPNGIQELYLHTLDRFFNSNKSQYTLEDYRSKKNNQWARPLSMILSSPEYLKKSTLKLLMDWDDMDLAEFCRPFASFLIEVDGCIIPFHKSFTDWIQSSRTDYSVSFSYGITCLAEACYDVYDTCPDCMDGFMLLYMPQFLLESEKTEHKKKYKYIVQDEGFTHLVEEYVKSLRYKRNYSLISKYYRMLLDMHPENEKYLEKYCRSMDMASEIYSTFNDHEKEYENDREKLEKLREMLGKYREMLGKNPDNINMLEQFLIMLHVMENSRENQQDEKKDFLYEEYETVKEYLREFPDNRRIEGFYYDTLSRLVSFYYNLDREEALKYKKTGLDYKKKLYEKNEDSVECAEDYINAMIDLAKYHRNNKEYDKAQAIFSDSIDLCKQLYTKFDSAPLLSFMRVYSELAGCYKEQGKETEMIGCYNEELDICSRYYDKFPDDRDVIRGYIGICSTLANIYKYKKEHEQVIRYYNIQRDILEKALERNPNNSSYANDYACLLLDFGRIYEEKRDMDAAAHYFMKCYYYCSEVHDKYFILINESKTIIDTYTRYKERIRINLRYYLEMKRKKAEQYPQNIPCLKELSKALGYYAEVEKLFSDGSNKFDLLNEKVATEKRIMELDPDNIESVQNYADTLYTISRNLMSYGEMRRQAVQYFEEILEIRKNIIGFKLADKNNIKKYIETLYDMAWINELSDQYEEMEKRYLEVLDIETEWNLSVSHDRVWEKLAKLYKKWGKTQKAIRYYKLLVESSRQYIAENDDDSIYTLLEYGLTLTDLGELTGDEEYFQEAIPYLKEVEGELNNEIHWGSWSYADDDYDDNIENYINVSKALGKCTKDNKYFEHSREAEADREAREEYFRYGE